MKRFLVLLMVIVAFAASHVAGGVPTAINYQGRLTDGSGVPVADGDYVIRFSIFTEALDGELLWSEVQELKVVDGLFSVLLGAREPLADSLFERPSCYLSIIVGEDTEILPRTMLVTVPWAFRVSTVDRATGGLIIGDLGISGKATIGQGHTNTGASAFVAGKNCNVTSDYATVGGGEGHTASGQYSTVGGGNNNTASNFNSVVGGGGGNIAAGRHSTIAGGVFNQALVDYSTVGGGVGNIASDTGAVVSGGFGNSATGFWSTVGGGSGNDASGPYASIGGGKLNVASDSSSTVGGGQYNYARGKYSVIAGGGGATLFDSNSALGSYSTIGGGLRNVATGAYSTISGGIDNSTLWQLSTICGGSLNMTFSNYASVGGGYNNKAIEQYSTVGGGEQNHASGQYSTVPGGRYNGAAGDYSFAAGFYAKANHNGSIVIAASKSTTFSDSVSSGGLEQMVLRVNGGLYITNIGEVAPYDKTKLITTRGGAYLSGSGTAWTNSSDRNKKENFAPVNGAELLDRISELPINEWNYKEEDESVRHIGPVAQDFYKIFALGGDDKSISTIDPAGIALAAIKALNEQNQQLKEQLGEMAKRLDKLESQ